MSDKIDPALTPEEWAAMTWVRPNGQPLVVHAHGGAGVNMLDIGSAEGEPDWQLFNEERHPLAALCLHGQSFGFDRGKLFELLRLIERLDGHAELSDEDRALVDWHTARISALLPPPVIIEPMDWEVTKLPPEGK